PPRRSAPRRGAGADRARLDPRHRGRALGLPPGHLLRARPGARVRPGHSPRGRAPALGARDPRRLPAPRERRGGAPLAARGAAAPRARPAAPAPAGRRKTLAAVAPGAAGGASSRPQQGGGRPPPPGRGGGGGGGGLSRGVVTLLFGGALGLGIGAAQALPTLG